MQTQLQSVPFLLLSLQTAQVFPVSNYEGLQICLATRKAPKTKVCLLQTAPESECFWFFLWSEDTQMPQWGLASRLAQHRAGLLQTAASELSRPAVPLGGGIPPPRSFTLLSPQPYLSGHTLASKGERSNANVSHLGGAMPPQSFGSVWRQFSLSHRVGGLLVPGGKPGHCHRPVCPREAPQQRLTQLQCQACSGWEPAFI